MTVSNIRTLLIDASYLLKRSFNGDKKNYTKSFGHIGGLYSFITTTRKLIKKYKVNKVILMWDGEDGGVDRHLIDLNYKGNRKSKKWHQKIEMSDAEIRREEEKEESLLKQRKRIQAYAEELYLRQIEVEEIEADDLIASYCINHHEDEDIYLYTNDRDFAQLIEFGITIIFETLPEPITKDNFLMHFPYNYKNALSVKIICGDTSDNIQGIKGIKEQTLMKHFPELRFKKMMVRDICKKAIEINKERVENKKKPLKALENLVENISRLKTNYKLMNLSVPFLNEQAISN